MEIVRKDDAAEERNDLEGQRKYYVSDALLTIEARPYSIEEVLQENQKNLAQANIFKEQFELAPAIYKEVKTIVFGDTAILRHVLVNKAKNKKTGNEMSNQYQRVYSFSKLNGQWKIVAVTAQALTQPEAISISQDITNSIAGEYEAEGENRAIFTSENNQLFWHLSLIPDSKRPLKAASENTFFMDNNPSRWTFIKNEAGKVTSCVIHTPDNQVLIRKKLK